jgi:AcrR family transcriptional regulator
LPKDTFFNLNEEKQEKVVRSAISQFAKNGYEKANVATIARNAGIAKGSMYQYFDNKKELFFYCLQWTVQLFGVKYRVYEIPKEKNVFDYFYDSAQQLLEQFSDEREVTLFIQDIFLDKYNILKDESLALMQGSVEDYIIKLIQDGKANKSIREDIDDKILALFMMGVSLKIKEYIINKARSEEKDIIDDYESYQKDIKAMLELLKNGMGGKNVY